MKTTYFTDLKVGDVLLGNKHNPSYLCLYVRHNSDDGSTKIVWLDLTTLTKTDGHYPCGQAVGAAWKAIKG